MMGEKVKRWRWALLCGFLLILGLAYSLWPRPVAVDLKPVSRGPMFVGVADNGVTREEELYVISAPVTGYASRIWLKAGDEVRKGQLITQMTGRPSAPLDQRNQDELDEMLVASQAAERSALASLRQAERDLVRTEALGKDGFVTLAQLEDARTRVVTEQTYLQQRQAESARIKALSSPPGATAKGKPVPVRTPISGLVLSVSNQSEGMLAEGTPLITLGNPAKIEIVIDLLSREAVRVTPGDRAEITQWGGPEPLIGTVKRVEPYGSFKVSALGVEEQRVNVIIGFDQEAAHKATRLGHGYQVDATIIVWSTANALRVPIEALFRDGDGEWRVFVVKGGRIRERQITIGHLNDEVGEVMTGLTDGEQVVLNPSKDLVDEMRVRSR